MKKLTFYLALLGLMIYGVQVYPQSSTMLLLMGDEDGHSPNPESGIYNASLTTPLSAAYKATLDSFIVMVKDSLDINLLSDAFDVMYDLGSETAEAGLKNLVKRSHDATAVNSPTFTQWEGFTSNSALNRYVNTNYKPLSDGVNITTTSTSMGFYSRTNISVANNWDMGASGASDANALTIRTNSGGAGLCFVYFGNTPAGSITSSNSSGFFVGIKVTGGASLYRNGSLLGGNTYVVGNMPDLNIYIGGKNNNGTASNITGRQYSFAFISKGLTATEIAKFTNCVEWLQDRKGKGVIP